MRARFFSVCLDRTSQRGDFYGRPSVIVWSWRATGGSVAICFHKTAEPVPMSPRFPRDLVPCRDRSPLHDEQLQGIIRKEKEKVDEQQQ